MSIRPRKSLLNPALKRPSALQSVPRNLNRIWLDKNENLDPELNALAHEVLQEISPLTLAIYPEACELYRKLAAWLEVSPECLLLTPGSDGAIRLSFEAFVENGDPVIHTTPTFAMYPVYSQMFGAEVFQINYERTDAGPYLDTAVILKVLREQKPKLLCLPNPDSPTGTVLAPEILREILSECEAVGTVLLLDEAYHPFYESSAVSWVEKSRNLIVARTFAKAWGVAGLRIGYAVAHPETIALLHKMRPMYEVSTLAVEFMSRMLDKKTEMLAAVARMNEGKTLFVESLRALDFKVLPTCGNFVHVAFAERGLAIHAALKDKVLYRVAFDHPCLAEYSRFSVGPYKVMDQVLELIQQAIGIKS
ncbi:MAG: histidinol-phosphate/aromatic aminotransferase and cobyric acid decarboxylase [Deltaproteobacteria bacterium CG11_big_fil_rev_8_21_14_0_20_42_23]|nr:MAG: histidinol-phosphate/aromatic aminotransferase and cobyric acid decarboxylase [Deltaproteobacteria bacterium CG11_big_fil_rev_8_21_14_0_20_42_23]PJC64530.1 MAG: histidinol-phosphate/aromatic aminotransferase and cobyric acid decarboxylase [Deltaproteobacteria bacterium CG_4_9_14_0_2_um_filter_42_21]